MKKGDLVKRVRTSPEAFYDEMPVNSFGVVIKGPYEKNVTDILYENKPWLRAGSARYVVLKRVIDIMFENSVYKFCMVEDYERVKSEKDNNV